MKKRSDIDALLSAPDRKAGRLQRACFELLRQADEKALRCGQVSLPSSKESDE